MMLLRVIRELRRAVLAVGHTEEIACRVVGVGDRLIVRVSDRGDAPVGIARKRHA